MPTELGLPEWDEIDQHFYQINSLLESYRPDETFYVGHLAKLPILLEELLPEIAKRLADPKVNYSESKLTAAEQALLGEYVKTFSRRLNCRNKTRRHFPVQANYATDRKDGNGCEFRFASPPVKQPEPEKKRD